MNGENVIGPTDIRCPRCNYSLRGLGGDGNCPECGLPVAHAASGDLLDLCDPHWLYCLVRGTRFKLALVALAIVWAIVESSLTPSPVLAFLVQAIVLAAALTWIIGTFAITVPEPGFVSQAQWNTVRRIVRIATVIATIHYVGQYDLFGASFSRSSVTAMVFVGIGFRFLAIFTELFYLRHLARRKPDLFLANVTTTLMLCVAFHLLSWSASAVQNLLLWRMPWWIAWLASTEQVSRGMLGFGYVGVLIGYHRFFVTAHTNAKNYGSSANSGMDN